MNIFTTLLYQPLVNGLIFFYQLFGANLGLAIIVMTILIRLLLLPITLPSLKASKKLKKLQPKLKKLKKKHKDDPQEFSKAQLRLYKEEGVSPASGCLPQIVRLVILIVLFRVFRQTLQANGDVVANLNQYLYPSLKLAKDTVVNTKFLYLDLTEPDLLKKLITLPQSFLNSLPELIRTIVESLPGPFLLGSAVAQFMYSKNMMGTTAVAEEKAKQTEDKADDMMADMQKQMLYFMPVMTLLIGLNFPSGLVLYWLSFSLFMWVQQLILRNKGENNDGD
jgi:YidC/Oxa1 family membrane protein insertase